MKNIGSNKTIETFNCELRRTEVDHWANELMNVYWINIESSINEFEEKYKKNPKLLEIKTKERQGLVNPLQYYLR